MLKGEISKLWYLVSVYMHILYRDLMVTKVQGRNHLPRNKFVRKVCFGCDYEYRYVLYVTPTGMFRINNTIINFIQRSSWL